MDDFIFRILCQALYDSGFSMSHDDAERLEKLLAVEFKKNPVYYSIALREHNLLDLVERFEFWSLR